MILALTAKSELYTDESLSFSLIHLFETSLCISLEYDLKSLISTLNADEFTVNQQTPTPTPMTTHSITSPPTKHAYDDASKARRWWSALGSWFITLFICFVFLIINGRIRAPELRGLAPLFTLKSVEGERYNLSELKGRTVVLNFWATWCGPCRFELPFLARWATSHPDVLVLGIAVDRELESVRAFLNKKKVTYPMLWDHAHVQRAYSVTTLPTTVVIGPDGAVEGAHTGVIFGPELDLLLP